QGPAAKGDQGPCQGSQPLGGPGRAGRPGKAGGRPGNPQGSGTSCQRSPPTHTGAVAVSAGPAKGGIAERARQGGKKDRGRAGGGPPPAARRPGPSLFPRGRDRGRPAGLARPGGQATTPFA